MWTRIDEATHGLPAPLAAVDLQALDAMARGESSAEIADKLARECPRRYKDPAQALRHAAELSLKYSKA